MGLRFLLRMWASQLSACCSKVMPELAASTSLKCSGLSTPVDAMYSRTTRVLMPLFQVGFHSQFLPSTPLIPILRKTSPLVSVVSFLLLEGPPPRRHSFESK